MEHRGVRLRRTDGSTGYREARRPGGGGRGANPVKHTLDPASSYTPEALGRGRRENRSLGGLPPPLPAGNHSCEWADSRGSYPQSPTVVKRMRSVRLPVTPARTRRLHPRNDAQARCSLPRASRRYEAGRSDAFTMARVSSAKRTCRAAGRRGRDRADMACPIASGRRPYALTFGAALASRTQSVSRSRSAALNAGWRSLVMASAWICRIRSRQT
jgi:hypothetical protein